MLGTDTGKNSEFYFIPRALDCYPLSYREGVVCTYDIWLSVCQKGVIYYEHFFFFRFLEGKVAFDSRFRYFRGSFPLQLHRYY